MKRLTTAVIVLVGTPIAAQHGGSDIHWEKDLATATARSKQTGKPVIAYFTFDT